MLLYDTEDKNSEMRGKSPGSKSTGCFVRRTLLLLLGHGRGVLRGQGGSHVRTCGGWRSAQNPGRFTSLCVKNSRQSNEQTLHAFFSQVCRLCF